jgi:hypothetical protein
MRPPVTRWKQLQRMSHRNGTLAPIDHIVNHRSVAARDNMQISWEIIESKGDWKCAMTNGFYQIWVSINWMFRQSNQLDFTCRTGTASLISRRRVQLWMFNDGCFALVGEFSQGIPSCEVTQVALTFTWDMAHGIGGNLGDRIETKVRLKFGYISYEKWSQFSLKNNCFTIKFSYQRRCRRYVSKSILS